MFAWEKPLFAPFDGVIIETANSCNDRKSLNLIRDLFVALVVAPRQKHRDTSHFLGNHIIMQSEQGIYALFAHLRRGSVCVKQGERVTAGSAIATIGNSGNTIMPTSIFS